MRMRFFSVHRAQTTHDKAVTRQRSSCFTRRSAGVQVDADCRVGAPRTVPGVTGSLTTGHPDTMILVVATKCVASGVSTEGGRE